MAFRKITSLFLGCALVVCVMVALEHPAYGYYVDPGSGLFLLQGISTAALGLLYALRRKLKLVKKPKEPEIHNAATSEAKSARVG